MLRFFFVGYSFALKNQHNLIICPTFIFAISRSRDYKAFLCSTQLSIKLIMLINVKMPTIVSFNINEHDKYNI